MAESSTIAVRIVADSRIECDALAWMLDQVPDFESVPDFGDDSADAAVAEAQVLLLDAELHASVPEVIARKRAESDARVLVMNVDSASDDISGFVKAGASGFVLRDASFDEFIGAIREVADGKTVLPPVLTDSLFSRIRAEPAEPASEDRGTGDSSLTHREQEVVDLICAGLSNQQIARRLNIGSNTVKSHVRNILVKLDLHSRLQIAAHTYTGQAD